MNLFITLEGPEGSGKSTQAPRLAEYLRQKGWQVLLTREPGGTFIGDQIRRVLHDLGNTSMHPRTELLLYSASRGGAAPMSGIAGTPTRSSFTNAFGRDTRKW